jgi:hypothetical protein
MGRSLEEQESDSTYIIAGKDFVSVIAADSSTSTPASSNGNSSVDAEEKTSTDPNIKDFGFLPVGV